MNKLMKIEKKRQKENMKAPGGRMVSIDVRLGINAAICCSACSKVNSGGLVTAGVGATGAGCTGCTGCIGGTAGTRKSWRAFAPA